MKHFNELFLLGVESPPPPPNLPSLLPGSDSQTYKGLVLVEGQGSAEAVKAPRAEPVKGSLALRVCQHGVGTREPAPP